MIARFTWQARNLNADQKKLSWSLLVNFATRVPGAFGLLLILPLFRFDLGTDNYAFLLGALALGTTTAFLYGGFNTMGRRLIGEALGREDKQGEAEGLMGLVVVSGLVTALALAVIAAYSLTQPRTGALFIIASFVAVSSFLNLFDNARAAYNEHYVTAVLQIVFQVGNLVLAYAFKSLRTDPFLACYLIQGHYILASAIAGGWLFWQRPYLLRGSLARVKMIAQSGLAIGLADGLLSAVLSLSVVWMQASATTEEAGWYATLMRLFQTILVPVILLLLPLSSYIRIIWHKKSAAQQRKVILATVLLGLGYGALASGALSIASVYYIEKLLKLPSPGHWLQLLGIYALFTGIIGYRSFSSIAYLVMDGGKLAVWITSGLLAALAIAAVLSRLVTPLMVIAIFGALVSVLLIAVETTSALRFRGSEKSAPGQI